MNIQEFSPSAVDSILVLLWKVVQHPNVRQYKAFDMVNDLFGQALRSVGEEGRQYSFLRESLDEVSRSAETEVKIIIIIVIIIIIIVAIIIIIKCFE